MILALLIAGVSVRYLVITRFTSYKSAIDRSSALRLVTKSLGASDALQMDMHDRIRGFMFCIYNAQK